MKNFVIAAVVVLFGVGGWIVFSPHANPQLVPTPSPVSTGSPQATASKGTATPQPQQAPGTYTMAQVAAHNSQSSCWTAINGSVYDLTQFVGQHPGGSGAIVSICGTDGTDAFNGKHGGQARPAQELAGLKIGTLAQ